MRVAGGVRRADLDQLDVAPADLDVEPAVEGPRRQAHFDAVELERTEERSGTGRPTSPGAALSAASIDGGTSVISCAVAAEAMISARSTSWLP